ncbi:sulfotransferase [Crocinitomicaceae bacterium]|nr:sulfotransferase [Crocinitomicaceae bacterium]
MNLPKIFLFCTERSGSNLITKLMNAHSEICGPSTKHILNPTFRNLHRYEPLDEAGNWSAFIEDLLNLFNVDFSKWEVSFSKNELIEQIETGDINALFHYIFDKETKGQSKKKCFIKEIKTYEIVPHINHYISGSKYVYLVRDPRDMALSWKKSNIHRGGIITAARQWKTDQQQYLKHYHLEGLNKNILKLHYEDLLEKTDTELQKLFSFIGVGYEEVHLNFHKDQLTRENSQKNEAWKNIDKGLLKNNKEKFLQELNAEEIAIIEYICKDEMAFLGYISKSTEPYLSEINLKKIDEMQRIENSLPYTPPPSVLENMKAKSRFYKR